MTGSCRSIIPFHTVGKTTAALSNVMTEPRNGY